MVFHQNSLSTSRSIARLTLAAVALAVFAPPAARAASPAFTVPGQALVRFRAGTAEDLQRVAHQRAGARVVRTTPATGWTTVSFPDATPLDAVIRSYAADPAVVDAEPNFVARATTTPSDACLTTCEGIPNQWHLELTNAALGWDVFPGRALTAEELRASDRVTIAVLDTHVDVSHPDFSTTGSTTDAATGGQLDLARARHWVPSSQWPGSIAWHGTLVAGLAAAAAGNRADAVGTGFPARVLPLTVLDGGGRSDASAVADAIVYAWDQGARVINLSLGILGDSQAVRDAISLVTKGTPARPPSLVVAAAGNNTGSTAFYPGSYPEVLSVSATSATDERASCSNYNGNVAVSAPGDRLAGLAPMPGRRMQAPCGTSAATPQVSGLAAMLFMQDASRTPADVRRIIEATSDDLGPAGRDDFFGHGRINVERALRPGGPRVSQGTATTPPAGGGESVVSARASGSVAIHRAQMLFDRPDAAPIEMDPADGRFDAAQENARAGVHVAPSPGAAPRVAYVRAFDGIRWGAATPVVVPVDDRAPTISGASAANGVRAAAQPMRVAFTASDDVARSVSYSVQFLATATGKVVHQDLRRAVAVGPQQYDWLPGLEVPAGHYNVVIAVADEAGNLSRTMVGAVLT